MHSSVDKDFSQPWSGERTRQDHNDDLRHSLHTKRIPSLSFWGSYRKRLCSRKQSSLLGGHSAAKISGTMGAMRDRGFLKYGIDVEPLTTENEWAMLYCKWTFPKCCPCSLKRSSADLGTSNLLQTEISMFLRDCPRIQYKEPSKRSVLSLLRFDSMGFSGVLEFVACADQLCTKRIFVGNCNLCDARNYATPALQGARFRNNISVSHQKPG
jgi:hypothetical protein